MDKKWEERLRQHGFAQMGSDAAMRNEWETRTALEQQVAAQEETKRILAKWVRESQAQVIEKKVLRDTEDARTAFLLFMGVVAGIGLTLFVDPGWWAFLKACVQ
jgi:hypothetical protein